MGLSVERFEVFGGGLLVSGKDNFRMHRDTGEPRFSVGTFFKVTDGFILVGIDDVPSHRSDRKERQHVATGKGDRKGLFGIYTIRLAEIGGG